MREIIRQKIVDSLAQFVRRSSPVVVIVTDEEIVDAWRDPSKKQYLTAKFGVKSFAQLTVRREFLKMVDELKVELKQACEPGD